MVETGCVTVVSIFISPCSRRVHAIGDSHVACRRIRNCRRILQPPPGIVTPALLRFSCPTKPSSPGDFEMSTPAVSLPDDPALLQVDGPIATITLNRPAAFNSINLAIAQKLETLSAEIEAADDIRVLVIESEGRA